MGFEDDILKITPAAIDINDTRPLHAVQLVREALVLAVRHAEYLALEPERVVEWVGKPCAVVDCFGILEDAAIARYFQLGCEVKGLGRGHIQRIKERNRK